MERPSIINFFPKQTTLEEAHEAYSKSPEMFKYMSELDSYADFLEAKLDEIANPIKYMKMRLEEGEQCKKQLCELLDLMPDLWSHRTDAAEFELSLMKKRAEHYEKALNIILDVFYIDGETDKEKVEVLKSIAFNALYEIENGLL